MMVACVTTGNWRDSERECFCVGREVVRERERQKRERIDEESSGSATKNLSLGHESRQLRKL